MKKAKIRKTRKLSRHKLLIAKKRPLYRRLTLHPVSIMLLLCIGVIMIGVTYQAFGASTTVSMTITALPLEEPASITSPMDQARFKIPDIIVRGTCPKDSYIKMYRNDSFSGVAPCVEGIFEMTITLRTGANVLTAKIFNLSNVEGPKSDSITVFYDEPVPLIPPTLPKPVPLPISNNSQNNSNLRIISDYTYKVHKSSQPVIMDLRAEGGVSPYAWAVDWNDGKISPIPRLNTSLFQAEHIYEVKARLNTYVIKVAVSDLDGNSDYIQLMAVVDRDLSSNTIPATPASPTASNFNDKFRPWLKYIWPAYLVVVLMVLSFYLGEREEYRLLSRAKSRLSVPKP